ncbi:MAG TPA: CPBP family intramembrane glutamic endopeptidase [Thermomicrobiales bacterium]
MDFIWAIISLLILLGAAYGMAYWANRAERDRSARVGLYILFGLPGTFVGIYGLAQAVNRRDTGWVWLAVALGMTLPLIPPVRAAFASFLPFNPASAVDMTGLCILLAAIGFLVTSYALDPSPADIDEAVEVSDLAVQFIAGLALAFITVGWRIKRSFREAVVRLGLTMPTPRVVGVGVGTVFIIFIVLAIAGVLTEIFQPDISREISQATQEITENVKNPVGAVFFGLGAGASEELLVRGAIQPKYGLIVSALLFALLHSQYGVSFVLLGVFLVGLVLGLERKYFGTTAAIITHAIFNTISVLLGS